MDSMDVEEVLQRITKQGLIFLIIFFRINDKNIYVYKTRPFAIQANRFFNIHGNDLDASAIAVNANVGPNIDISSHKVLLFPNNVVGAKSCTGDVFNLYDSGTTDPTQRLKIHSNIIVVGSRGQQSRDGISVGAVCLKGSNVEVKNNLLLNSGVISHAFLNRFFYTRLKFSQC